MLQYFFNGPAEEGRKSIKSIYDLGEHLRRRCLTRNAGFSPIFSTPRACTRGGNRRAAVPKVEYDAGWSITSVVGVEPHIRFPHQNELPPFRMYMKGISFPKEKRQFIQGLNEQRLTQSNRTRTLFSDLQSSLEGLCTPAKDGGSGRSLEVYRVDF